MADKSGMNFAQVSHHTKQAHYCSSVYWFRHVANGCNLFRIRSDAIFRKNVANVRSKKPLERPLLTSC